MDADKEVSHLRRRMDTQSGPVQHQGAYSDHHHGKCTTLGTDFGGFSYLFVTLHRYPLPRGPHIALLVCSSHKAPSRIVSNKIHRYRGLEGFLQSRCRLGIRSALHHLVPNDRLWAGWDLPPLLGVSCCHDLAPPASELCAFLRSSRPEEARSSQLRWLDHLQIPMVPLCLPWIVRLVLVPRFYLARLIRVRLHHMDSAETCCCQPAFWRFLWSFTPSNHF